MDMPVNWIDGSVLTFKRADYWRMGQQVPFEINERT